MISTATAFRTSAVTLMTLSAWGDSTTMSMVYHTKAPVSTSVKMMEPLNNPPFVLYMGEREFVCVCVGGGGGGKGMWGCRRV